MPGGRQVLIEHAGVDEAKGTLGCWSCPSDKAKASIKTMTGKAQEWVDRAKESRLQRRDIWFLVDHQMWPRVGHGISSNTAPWSVLDLC